MGTTRSKPAAKQPAEQPEQSAELIAQLERAKRQQLRTEHPDAWVFVDEGDQLTGEVSDVQEAWSEQRGDNGSWYPLLTVKVEDADGYETGAEVKVHCFSAVLYNEVMRRQPRVGERLRISYEGTRPPRVKGHSPTKIYLVKVYGRENEGADVYSRIGSEQPASTVGHRRAGQAPAQQGAPAPASDFDPASMQGGDDEIPF